MAHPEALMGLSVIIFTMLWAGTTAQSRDCVNVLFRLLPCVNHINQNSSPTPSGICCSQLRSAVLIEPQCVCEELRSGMLSSGTQGIALQRYCNIENPITSQCNATSTSGSPAPTPNHTNINPGGRSCAASDKLALSMLFCFLFIASYVSIFDTA